LARIKQLCKDNEEKWPVADVVGYLEIGGPKLGRDYSDPLLGEQLRSSLAAIHREWETVKI
jgi:ribulose-phosphate 3-epimerase